MDYVSKESAKKVSYQHNNNRQKCDIVCIKYFPYKINFEKKEEKKYDSSKCKVYVSNIC